MWHRRGICILLGGQSYAADVRSVLLQAPKHGCWDQRMRRLLAFGYRCFRSIGNMWWEKLVSDQKLVIMCQLVVWFSLYNRYWIRIDCALGHVFSRIPKEWPLRYKLFFSIEIVIERWLEASFQWWKKLWKREPLTYLTWVLRFIRSSRVMDW